MEIEHVLNKNESLCCSFTLGHVPKDKFIKEFCDECGGDEGAFSEQDISHGRILTRNGSGYFGNYKIGASVTYYKQAI